MPGRPIIHNKWLLVAAVVWACVAVLNFKPPAGSTTPGYLWVVNLLTAVCLALVSIRRPKDEDLKG
ncbi:hypothetical protein GCM10009087_05470 [Sphingomonas oligophenolica]